MKETFAPWWWNAVGYQIYPTSYYDSNGDGMGDLQGIIQKLPYLKELGVNLLYLCPVFDSPMKDGGYDVRDFYKINPDLGTLEDLKTLIAKCHEAEMHIILDLPINHTSDQCPFFQEALNNPNSDARSHYIFKEGRRDGDRLLPPTNWASFFGGSAWERVGDSDIFYLHTFGKESPDINWENPTLREEVYKIANFYVSLGVDGFRLDAAAHLAKDRTYSDSTLPADPDGTVRDFSKFSLCEGLHGYLTEFYERVAKGKNLLLIGEMGGSIQPEKALEYTNYRNGPLNMVFNFDTVCNNGAYESFKLTDSEIKTDVIALKRNFMRWYDCMNGKSDLPIYWENHDYPRVISQYGDVGEHRREAAKMLLINTLFLYGTPFIYYGDEIGMSNLHFDKIDDFNIDPQTAPNVDSWRKRGYSDEEILRYLNRSSRLSSRSAMQWDKNKPFAGFSSVEPKMPLNPNYKEGVDIQSQMEDPYSILNFFQYAINLRKKAPYDEVVKNGALKIIDSNHPDVFSYLHEGLINLMVISNMRPYQVYFSFYNDIKEIPLQNYGDVILNNHVFTLRPFECLLIRIR